jgi:FKBP-type peptidyl-prolyl cis-trans isomerase FkpA
MKWMRLAALAAVVLVVNACSKKTGSSCTNVDPATEASVLEAYAAANGITTTKHSSGMYYQIINPGSGTSPTVYSRIYIEYTGKKLDGTVFDSQNSAINTGWYLNSLIAGWQIGIPLLKKGGTIRLLIPSALAYGCTGAGSGIPANTPLDFSVRLVDFQ